MEPSTGPARRTAVRKLLWVVGPLVVLVALAAFLFVRKPSEPGIEIKRATTGDFPTRGDHADDDALVRRAITDWRADSGGLRPVDAVTVRFAGKVGGRLAVVLDSGLTRMRWSAPSPHAAGRVDASDDLRTSGPVLRVLDDWVLLPAGYDQQVRVARTGAVPASDTSTGELVDVGKDGWLIAPATPRTGNGWQLLASVHDGPFPYDVRDADRAGILRAMTDPASAVRLQRALTVATDPDKTDSATRTARVLWTGTLPGEGDALAVSVTNGYYSPTVVVGRDEQADVLGRAAPNRQASETAPVLAGGVVGTLYVAIGEEAVSKIDLLYGATTRTVTGRVAVVPVQDLGPHVVTVGRAKDGTVIPALPTR